MLRGCEIKLKLFRRDGLTYLINLIAGVDAFAKLVLVVEFFAVTDLGFEPRVRPELVVVELVADPVQRGRGAGREAAAYEGVHFLERDVHDSENGFDPLKLVHTE